MKIRESLACAVVLWAGTACSQGPGGAQEGATGHTYQVRLSQSASEELMRQRVEPDYPEALRATGISGQALIRFGIDKHGKVIDVSPVRDAQTTTDNQKILDAMVNAVSQWKFKPYMLGNEPVEVETMTLLKFDFEAQKVPPKAAPARVRVSMAVFHNNLIRTVEPDYPMELKKNNIEGDVILDVIVDRKGDVADLKPLSAVDTRLIEAAMKAVKHWKFKPYLLNGQPVEVETTIKVRFQMKN